MTKHLLADLKQNLKENDYCLNGDRWAAAMGLFFDVAAFVYEENDVPSDWGYRPGAMGNFIDSESYNYEWLNSLTAKERLELGSYLHKLTGLLKLAGVAY